MRNFINIITESDTVYLYHGTSLKSLDGIRAHGLLPHSPPDYSWPEFDDEDDDNLPDEAFEKRLFATPNEFEATQYSENNIDPVILRFPYESADWETDFGDLGMFHYTTGMVSPEDIEVKLGDQWKKLSENS